jgi:glycosyltransferase involved in cell wall biosynthesis
MNLRPLSEYEGVPPGRPVELSVAIIAKDEEENIRRCLESVVPHVDEVIVVDTGSTDRTIAVAERCGAKVYPHDPHTNPDSFFLDDAATCSVFGAPPPFSGEVMLGDFGAARRAAFAHARGEYVMWIDADDELEGGAKLREIVGQMRARGLDMAFFPYDYARDDQGRVFYRQWRERIIKAGCATWVNPVHEVLLPTRPTTSAQFEGVNFVHHRKADRKTAPNRNYKILLRQHALDKKNGASPDPRTLFYLGQEARWIEPSKALAFYEDYLARSGWGEERAAAHVALGSMCEFGQLPGMTVEEAYARANREYATAAADMPNNPDGLHGLGRIAYLRGRYHDCVGFIERAFAIGNTESMLGANPRDRDYRPHIYYNHALAKLGRLEEAAASCRAGLAACPDDPGVPGGAVGMLKYNLAEYERAIAAAKVPPSQPAPMAVMDKNEDVDAPPLGNLPPDVAVIWAMQLWKQCVARSDEAGARAVLRAASWLADPVLGKMQASTDRRWPPASERLYRIHPDPGPGFIKSWGDLPDISPDWGTWGITGACDYAMHRKHEGAGHIGSSLTDFLDKEGIREEVDALTEKRSLRVVFYLGPCFERWDPTSLDRGIGGSETAAIHMARELAARGHNVNVYADPEMPGTFAGVCYHRHEKFRGEQCDVFVSSRAPWAIDQFGPVRARVKLLWVHDVDVGADGPQMQRHLLAFDRVLCLSEWHRGYFLSRYVGLDPAKVLVTRNGIDPRRFGLDLTDGPYKTNTLVWSSSPPRGLDNMLYNFQLIRQRVPDVELRVYYGFDCWEAFARARGATAELAEIQRYKDLLPPLGGSRDGVHYHGRVGQQELAQAFMRAKVWPYLSGFPETSCISAMEAQAAGCLPVCSNAAALPETVKHGVVVDIARADAPQVWFDAVVRALTDEDWRRPQAEAARAYALSSLSWSGLAAEWEAMFARVESELVVNPLSKFVEVG